MNAYRHLQRALPPLLVFSLVSNLAVLISPLFMMQVLDRVIPSGNTATLLLLGGLALASPAVTAGLSLPWLPFFACSPGLPTVAAWLVVPLRIGPSGRTSNDPCRQQRAHQIVTAGGGCSAACR